MRKLIILLAGLVMCAMIALPVSAYPAPSNDNQVAHQDSNAVAIGGSDNTVISNNYNNQVDVDQKATTTVNGGHDNTAIALNANGDIVAGDKITGAAQVSNTQSMTLVMANNPTHSVLDTGAISAHVVSLYSGEVYVVENDYELDNEIRLQKAGYRYKYSIKSSSPVLCYLIDAHDVDKVKSKSGAPEYDPVRQIFEHGWVNVVFPKIYDNQMYSHPSTNQWFTATLPDDGRYALVIDTRTTSNLNGIQTEITPNTIDIAYLVEKLGTGAESKYTRTYTGETVVYKTLESGKLDNTEELVITH